VTSFAAIVVELDHVKVVLAVKGSGDGVGLSTTGTAAKWKKANQKAAIIRSVTSTPMIVHKLRERVQQPQQQQSPTAKIPNIDEKPCMAKLKAGQGELGLISNGNGYD
jgi:hypothetical protein